MNWKFYKGIGSGLVLSSLLWLTLFQVARESTPTARAALRVMHTKAAMLVSR